jgi:hypothetical protein
MGLDDIGNGINENLCIIQCGRDVHGAVLDGPRGDTNCLTSCYINSGPGPGGQVAPALVARWPLPNTSMRL